MSKRIENGPLGWLLVIPTVVVGCILAVAYGVACMTVWALQMAFKGSKNVRPQ